MKVLNFLGIKHLLKIILIFLNIKQNVLIYNFVNKYFSFTEFTTAFSEWKKLYHHPFRVASSEFVLIFFFF